MELSAGILILNEHREILLGHVTGQPQWDIPKGCVEPGESPAVAALRELVEETSLILEATQLIEIGRRPYLSDKALHLFETKVLKAAIVPERLVCTSTFSHKSSGLVLPELDNFAWAPVAQLDQWCSAKMLAVIGPLFVQRGWFSTGSR